MARLVGLKGGGAIAQSLGVNSPTKEHALGTRALDELGNEYIYLQGIGSTAAGDFVVFDEAFLTARMTKAEVDKLKPVAVAQAATVASQYGWYAIAGEFATTEGGNALALCAKEVAIYTSATTGSADDDASGTTKLNRLVVRTTLVGAGRAAMWMHYPSAG